MSLSVASGDQSIVKTSLGEAIDDGDDKDEDEDDESCWLDDMLAAGVADPV